jgi:uncharacterized protein (TIGR03435 family)
LTRGARTMLNRFVATIGGVCLFVLAAALQCGAQSSLADSWQGTLTLHPGQDFRILVKISKDNDGYKAITYSIDQGISLPVTKITFDGTTVKMTLETQPVIYDGKLGVDGKTISGTWKQGPNSFPLTLVRTPPEMEWVLPGSPSNQPSMDANASPAFEVATFKPSPPDATSKGLRLSRHEFAAFDTNLNDLIIFAFGLHPKQVIGVPAWAATDKFDIKAEPEGEGLPSLNQWKSMVRKLLEDRCKLSFHHERTELPVYVLSVSKTGPKLTPSLGSSMGLPALGFRGRTGGDISASNATIGDFLNFMTRNVKLDRPIVDETGILGRYDFTLDWSPDDTQFGGAAGRMSPSAENPSTAPSLYTAVQEQLGLKLEATKAPVEVMVIDRIEKPSEN